jgi:DNA sulfur modification protein DndD
MKVSINQITTKGLRCPDSIINFKDRGSGAALNLLQMPNATGKTTIIKLLAPTLSGQIRNWSPNKVKSFKSRDDIFDGEFSLTLSIDTNNNSSKIKFIVRFDFEHGKVDFNTKRSQEAGEEHGWHPPRELRQYITEGCVDVFCFRGDKVKDLIDQKKEDAEVTIRAFFGISDIGSFLQEIKTHFQTTVTQGGSSVNNKAIKSKKILLEQWEKRFKALKSKFDEKTVEKIEIEIELKDMDDARGSIIAAQENGTINQLKYSKAVQKAEIDVQNSSFECWNALKDPFLISKKLTKNLYVIRGILEKMKLPGGSRTFFEEMIERDEDCICGDKLTKYKIDHIQKSIESYLGTSEINIVNQIKEEIKSAYNNQDNKDNLNSFFYALKEAVIMRDRAKIDESDFLQDIKDKSSVENKKIFGDYQKKGIQHDQVKRALSTLSKEYKVSMPNQSNPKACNSYVAAEDMIMQLSNELGVMSNMIDDVEANTLLNKVILMAKNNSLEKIKDRVKNLTNVKILESLPAGSEIEVQSFSKQHLQLGWNGKEQEEGSGAQNIIVAYSFVRAVLEEATIEFPLIVDHPFTNVDFPNRKYLGSKLTTLMHQFIGFLIDTEREGFLQGVDESGESVRYLSLFRIEEQNKVFIDKIEKLEEEMYFKSSNGFLCCDKKFFIENKMGDH